MLRNFVLPKARLQPLRRRCWWWLWWWRRQRC